MKSHPPIRPLEVARSRHLRPREGGAMLIVTMGVLTLLAVLGTTFVSLMRLEKKATRNYIDAQVVDLINASALERVISDTRGALNFLSYTSYNSSRSPWLYKLRGDDVLAHGREPVESDRVGRWDILSEDKERVYRYKTKVIDCSAQININGKQDSLGRMLDNLAMAIVRSPNLRRGSQHPLWTGPNQTGDKISGNQILEFRNKLEGRRFRRKSQLRELIGEENYETIKDFITIYSWTDPYTYKPSDAVPEVLDLQIGGGGGRALGGGSRASHPPVVNPSAPLEHEPRSPVNINTAPEEVLVACLMGIAGRRPFPYSRIVYTPIDEGAQITGMRVPGEEERDNAMPRAVWVYSQRLEYDQAIKIARRIVEHRKNAATPFMAWSTGQSSKPGFAEFINQLEESFFPPPTTAVIIDPKNLQDNRIRGEIVGATPVSVMWRKGHNNRERQHRIQAGMPYHPANAFYYDLVKSAIISNFNPNSRISRYNPNLAAFTPVDKSDLVALDQQDRMTPRAGYTTEFCFDTMGYYEITTLGEIARRDKLAGGGEEAAFEPLYRKKLTTVAQVFGVVRHTNQFHFEKTFSGKAGNRNSRDFRNYVVTWPDPMLALTDAVTQGSVRDGRIELAGLKDGQRAEMGSYSNIVQSFRSPETILMGKGFQDRDDASYAQLRRMAASGAASTDYSRRVQDVWDADYSKKQSAFRKHYDRASLVPLLGGQTALAFDPRAETEEFGTHLRPDGIHNSIINSDHLGVSVLHLPAHGVIGQGLPGKVGTGAQVGAGPETNANGNVAYYNGGIAFWVKFDFDGDDPVFSGLIGCTQVIEDVAKAPQEYDGSEGTQFFIFKNTKGWLRVVRMYYHEAFPAIGGEGGEASVSQLRPTLSDLMSETGGSEQVQQYLDPRKPVARADLIVDVRHFRAHEWHHIAVDWNDANPGEVLKIYVDFERVQGGVFIPQDEVADLPTAWVRLNQRRPIDGLFIGGFLRHQGASDAGIFKWFTNTFSDSQGRGIRPIEPTVKRILANATIDEVITYTGTFQSVKRYFVPTGSPGYFTNQTGVYANVMEIPLPPEVDHVVMRSFDWTSYYPTFFWGNYTTRTPDRLRVSPIQCTVHLARNSPQPFNEVWQRPNIRNPVAGNPVMRALGGKGLKGRNAELVYEFRIPPAIQSTGAMGGGAVATPVIDDVTATYFLPSPRILYQEEAD